MTRCETCTHYLPARYCGSYPAMAKHGFKGACTRPGLFYRVAYLPEGESNCGSHRETSPLFKRLIADAEAREATD